MNVVEIPMSSEVILVVRTTGRDRSLTFALIGGLVGIVTVLLALSGGIGPMLTVPVGVVAATFLALAWFTWSRAREDLASGMMIRASGTINLHDKTTSSDSGLSRRACKLIAGDATLAIGNAAADLIRSHVSAVTVKETSNWLTDTSGDEFAFVGTVEYAPRSSLLLSVRTAKEGIVWQHLGLAPDASARTT
jgi:hypothetical protein